MTPPADVGIAPLVRDDTDIPEPSDDSRPVETGDETRSLIKEIEALIGDGKTYLEAELGFQKSRAAFVADRAKSAIVFGAAAALLALLALVGLAVGAIIALAPILTPWGSTALVVAILLALAALAARAAGRRWRSLMAAIVGDGGQTS